MSDGVRESWPTRSQTLAEEMLKIPAVISSVSVVTLTRGALKTFSPAACDEQLQISAGDNVRCGSVSCDVFETVMREEIFEQDESRSGFHGTDLRLIVEPSVGRGEVKSLT